MARNRGPGRISAAGSTHFVLQFTEFPDSRARRAVEERGMRILEYIPGNALLVAGSPGRLDGLASWVDALEAQDKMSPDLNRQTGGPLLVEFYQDVAMDRARSVVANLGFDVIENPGLLPGHLVVTGQAARIEALAEQDEVE